MKKIGKAIISLTDKTNIEDFAKKLSGFGVEIISTGGTAKLIEKSGTKVTPISDVTGFPEMLDGRVKTLHPKIHGGLLGIRDNKKHQQQMKEQGIEPIDMVVVNLYAFEETIKKGATLEEAIENIDIGGPTMLRSAAKNFNDVAVVTDPNDYEMIMKEMDENDGALSSVTRFYLAKKVFELTARYDGAIANYLGTFSDDTKEQVPGFPATFNLNYEKVQDLRYGENPHQVGAFYKEYNAAEGTLAKATQLQGKELSFNNILDTHAALGLSRDFTEPACIIVKHNNPCGAAEAHERDGGLAKAYELALECDPTSAFGGIVGFNRNVTKDIAEKLKDIFLEVIVAPSFDKDALKVFAKKKNLRLLSTGEPCKDEDKGIDIKKVSGGVLIQTYDSHTASDLKTATDRAPTEEELKDLLFAWNVGKHVKSNAIIFAKNGQTIGIGAGQMSRIDSTELACHKAEKAGLDIKGTVMASDAFFPFRDNVDLAAEKGITAIIQPGGSIRDDEVIAACNEHGIAMVFTSMRHFRH